MELRHAKGSIPRERWRWKSVLGIVACITLGILFLGIGGRLEPGTWRALCDQLSTVLLVGGLWAGLYEFFLRREFMRMHDESCGHILDRISLAEGEKRLGLVNVVCDSYEYSYESMLLSSQQVRIVLNDGRTWVSRHSEVLQRRLQDDSKTTTFFLLHPSSPMLQVLARKVDSSPEMLRNKIGETVAMLRSLARTGGNLTILGHHLYNPNAIFVGDDAAVVTLYLTSRGRACVPAFVFKKGEGDSYYRKLDNDLRDLQHDAEDILGCATEPQGK